LVTVIVLDGEAFFKWTDIATKPKRIFMVYTPEFHVKIGTICERLSILEART
jgi:hypothetical protein